MSKKMSSVLAVYVIVFIVFSVVFFAVPFPKVAPAIIAYIFSVISAAAAYFITRLAFDKGANVRSKVYGFPVFRVGAIYMAAQIIFTLIIAAAGKFTDVANWVVIVVSVIFAGLAAVGVIGTDNARDIIEEHEKVFEAQTKAMKYFRVDAAGIAALCGDAALKKKLEKLEEEFRYSDPVSSEELESIEAQISTELDSLRALISSDTVAADKKADAISVLLADRNRKCKALKK